MVFLKEFPQKAHFEKNKQTKSMKNYPECNEFVMYTSGLCLEQLSTSTTSKFKAAEKEEKILKCFELAGDLALLCLQVQIGFYAPNFEKVDGAYCFWSVRGCVHGWVTLFVPTVTFKQLKLES